MSEDTGGINNPRHITREMVGQPTGQAVCDIGNPNDRIACMKEMDAIEESREKRHLRSWVIRFALFVTSTMMLLIVGGGLYGWLFKEKAFLDGVIGVYFTHIVDIAKIVFGI